MKNESCIKCGAPLNEGEAKCFTVCEDCWPLGFKPAPQSVTPAPVAPSHPTQADFDLADLLKKECFRKIPSGGDRPFHLSFDEQLAAVIIANHVAAALAQVRTELSEAKTAHEATRRELEIERNDYTSLARELRRAQSRIEELENKP